MEVYVTLDGISQLPRPCAVTYMEANMVRFFYCIILDSLRNLILQLVSLSMG